MRRRSRAILPAMATAVLLAVYAAQHWDAGETSDPCGGVPQLFAQQRSGVVVEGDGAVARILPDDRRGSRHQRFILRLPCDHSLLVSHNIDLAPRVEGIEVGDDLAFRGQYEWNDRGGVLHWTHHDPEGDRPGGWLRHEGSTYR